MRKMFRLYADLPYKLAMQSCNGKCFIGKTDEAFRVVLGFYFLSCLLGRLLCIFDEQPSKKLKP